MDRRAFISIVGGSLLAAPRAAVAQPAGKVYRIGVLGSSPPTTPAAARSWDAFVQGLREQGFVEGQNVVFVRRYSEGYEKRHAGVAAEFVQMKVDLMVTGSSAAARFAKDATNTIPIVMLGVANPERQGLVASLARPGGNVTGMSSQLHEVSGKTYQLVQEALPRLFKLAIMWNPDNPASVIRFKEGDVPAAAALKIALVSLEVRRAEDLDRAFATIALERPEALWVHLTLLPFRTRILEFAGKNRLPTGASESIWPQSGGLMSYGPDSADLTRRAATHVAKILRGAKPADLPVEQATKFDLVINLKTAKALGLTIPQSVLLRADQVIE